MPIDSTDDVEVVETQIESGTEQGNQVEGLMIDVDPEATDAEIAGSNLIRGGDFSWDDVEDDNSIETEDAGGESVPKPDTSGEPNQRERTYESLSPEEGGADQKPSPPERDDNALISESREKAEAEGNGPHYDQVTAQKVAEWHGNQAEEQRQHQNEG